MPSSGRFNRPRGRQASPAATAGVQPIGRVRRSQLVSTYGIGSIVDLEKGSFMPMGLDDWESATRLPSLTIGEARLQAQLGVTHFRLPPTAEDLYGLPGRVDASHCIPAVRFPAWHQCPKCNRIGTEGKPFQLSADGTQLECGAHSKPLPTNPVRFVVACRKGHMDDFPWEWWAHRRRDGGICDRPQLELGSRGKSAALGDLYVKCRHCNSSASLGDAFRPDSLGNAGCRGVRPWLHDRQEGCDSPPRVIQRGASNAHFAVIASAISIPPVSEATFQIIDGQWLTLGALPEEAVRPVLASLAATYGVPIDSLVAAYNEKQKIDGNADRTATVDSRAEEYSALSVDRDDPVVGGIVPQFCNSVSPPPEGLRPWFDLVGAVSRLREVRALAGFSRIEPYPVSAEKVAEALRDGAIAPLSKTPRNWLPAAEIRGEGLFLRFRASAIGDWLKANPGLEHRVAKLERRSRMIAEERGYPRGYSITARLLLVHSFAHALIRTISVDCGYSSSALRERLYISEGDSQNPPMNGVLIYTGSPDSEGSLGGLVRLADPHQIEHVVRRAILSARWCGSDPVCIETDPDQSGERISGAACHCCLLLPETACEKFNRELDRTMLVGSADDGGPPGWRGFFADLAE
ncbi:DrmB family protein [Piscinibacterium candidicorallinum]